MLYFILTLMIIFAFLAIQSSNLMKAVILLSSFSVLCSIAYFILHAPDVAIAEAVIGCSLSTILFIVALRKYQIFNVYVVSEDDTDSPCKLDLKEDIYDYVNSISLEVNYVSTKEPVEKLIINNKFDSIVICSGNTVKLHGYKSNYHFELMCDYFEDHSDYEVIVEYIEQVEMELV